jgi:cytochrome c biogenesis protein CcdA
MKKTLKIILISLVALVGLIDAGMITSVVLFSFKAMKPEIAQFLILGILFFILCILSLVFNIKTYGFYNSESKTESPALDEQVFTGDMPLIQKNRISNLLWFSNFIFGMCVVFVGIKILSNSLNNTIIEYSQQAIWLYAAALVLTGIWVLVEGMRFK